MLWREGKVRSLSESEGLRCNIWPVIVASSGITRPIRGSFEEIADGRGTICTIAGGSWLGRKHKQARWFFTRPWGSTACAHPIRKGARVSQGIGTEPAY